MLIKFKTKVKISHASATFINNQTKIIHEFVATSRYNFSSLHDEKPLDETLRKTENRELSTEN